MLAAVALLAGCKAETFGGEDPVIDPDALQVVAGVRLPGGRITVSAPWMATVADTMTLVVDDRTELLAVRDTGGPDRFFFYLPDTLPVGSHQLDWQTSGRPRIPIGYITTGGFTQLRYATGSFYAGYGAVQPLPELVAVAGMGDYTLGGCNVVLLDARNARFTQVGTMPICGYGLGASYLPATFLAYRGGATWNWSRVSVAPTGPHSDSIPVYGNWWPKHELAPGLYLRDEKYITAVEDDSAGTYQMLDVSLHPARIAFSPDGRWAAASHDHSAPGAMIVDRQGRAFHWSPGWTAYTRPLFLPDGRLVLYGWRSGPTGNAYGSFGPFAEYLAHVDPVTGALADSVWFGDAGSPYDLPVALQSGLIVMPGWTASHLELSFRDPNTLLEVAHVRSPDFSSSCSFDSTVPSVEDPATHRLYLMLDDCNAAVPVWTFQLPD